MLTPDLVRQYRNRLGDLEGRLAEPGTAAQPRKFQELVREHARVRRVVLKTEAYNQALRHLAECRQMMGDPASDPEMKQLARDEAEALDRALPALERDALRAMLPPDPADDRNVILEIRAGTGGDEAALFAGDLFRMYSRYAEAQGWKVAILDANPAEVGGYKEIVAAVDGDAVFRTLKFESGVHRVQRVPATEAQGRVHTSAASVVVLPEAAESDDDAIVIADGDLRIDTFRASGAGGQHVNRTDSAVRLTHLATGIVVACQAERSQIRNREKAMAMLKARLLDRRRQEEGAKTGDLRRSAIGSGDRSEKVRTYNFPQNRLTDHRINLTLYNLDRVMEGDLQAVIEALHEQDMEIRMKAQLESVR